MARSVNTRTYSSDDGTYGTFEVIQRWDSEDIPLRVELIEQTYYPGHEYEIEVEIIPTAYDDFTIKTKQGQVLFSLRNIRDWLEAEYYYNNMGDIERDKKKDDELTEGVGE